MKSIFVCLCLAFAGCATTSTTPTVQALLNPNNLAVAAQDTVSAGVALVLARNPSYQGAISAVADALVATAASNPGQLSSADIVALLAKTGLNSTDQAEITAGVIAAQGVYLSAFKGVSLPTLKPVYQLFLDAVANGIYLATGHATVTLPVIPIPAAPAAPAA